MGFIKHYRFVSFRFRNGPVTARGQEMGTMTGNFPVLPPLRACMRGQTFRILLHRSLTAVHVQLPICKYIVQEPVHRTVLMNEQSRSHAQRRTSRHPPVPVVGILNGTMVMVIWYYSCSTSSRYRCFSLYRYRRVGSYSCT